jgi:hypothetical protein
VKKIYSWVRKLVWVEVDHHVIGPVQRTNPPRDKLDAAEEAPVADPECATLPPSPTSSLPPSPSATDPMLADQTALPLPAVPGYEILAELGRAAWAWFTRHGTSTLIAWSPSR